MIGPQHLTPTDTSPAFFISCHRHLLLPPLRPHLPHLNWVQCWSHCGQCKKIGGVRAHSDRSAVGWVVYSTLKKESVSDRYTGSENSYLVQESDTKPHINLHLLVLQLSSHTILQDDICWILSIKLRQCIQIKGKGEKRTAQVYNISKTWVGYIALL